MIVLFAIWRRWFGGLCESIPILKERGLQALVFILLNTYVLSPTWLNLIISIYTYAILWSLGHGAFFDIGSGKVTQETAKRYQEAWGYNLVNKLPIEKYGTTYDFILMTIRYTLPSLPLIYINPLFGLFGLATGIIYLTCVKVFNKHQTKLAELLVGALYGYLICL